MVTSCLIYISLLPYCLNYLCHFSMMRESTDLDRTVSKKTSRYLRRAFAIDFGSLTLLCLGDVELVLEQP